MKEPRFCDRILSETKKFAAQGRGVRKRRRKMGFKGNQYKWKDRKRHLGMPLSFTRYALSEDRLFLEVGFFNIKD